MKRTIIAMAASLCALVSSWGQFNATVNPAENWVGYMNVFALPSDGGGYMFGGSWGTADLPAVFGSGTLTLWPNTNTYDNNPGDAYWINPTTGAGNKSLEANFFVESTALRGQTVNFSGTVQSNTLTQDYTAIAIIKVLDANSGYSVAFSDTAPLVAGNFNLSLQIPDGGNYIPQYGFQVLGPNAPSGHSFGNVVVTAVPEPSTWALVGGMFALGFVAVRRMRGVRR